jgi:hypothetical protein
VGPDTWRAALWNLEQIASQVFGEESVLFSGASYTKSLEPTEFLTGALLRRILFHIAFGDSNGHCQHNILIIMMHVFAVFTDEYL